MANREHGGVRRVGVVLLVVFFAVTTAARAADEARSLQRVYALTVKEIDGPLGQGRMFRAEDWDEKGPRFDTGDPAISWKPET